MITPFDSPTLWIASLDGNTAGAIGTFLEPFLGQQIQHRFTAHNILTLNTREQLHTMLDEQTMQDLFNSVCVVDLSTSERDFQFDLRADARHPLRPTELILRYPEVYWIFIVDNLPDWTFVEEQLLKTGISHHLLSLHFVKITHLMDLVLRLGEHAAGFRTIFDPTGLRFLVLSASNASNDKQNDIAPLGLRLGDNFDLCRPITYGISLEDEISFALLNGYFLYKQGYSTFVIATLGEYKRSAEYAEYLSTDTTKESPIVWNVIEDVELCYADALGNLCTSLQPASYLNKL